MTKKIFILGSGGQGRQVESILYSVDPKAKVEAFLVKDNNNSIGNLHGIPVLGESILNNLSCDEILLINGMGRPNRKQPIERLINKGYKFMKLIHPSAYIGKYVAIDEGTVIQSGVQFMTDISVGKFTLLDLSSTIGHDVIIGDYTTISTGVNIAGGVQIGSGTWIGSGSVIIEGVKIGNNSVIGAGSVVTKNIEANRLAYGVPAKEMRIIDDASKVLIKH